MILKIDLTSEKTAKEIRTIFQASYAVEAKLLKAKDFPPLKRPLSAFLNSANTFYGYHLKDTMVAVLELKQNIEALHIQSLVVLPEHLRKGIASALIQYVLQHHNEKVITVETGLANVPATALYVSFGFVKIKEWNTDHGVRKVAFELKRL